MFLYVCVCINRVLKAGWSLLTRQKLTLVFDELGAALKNKRFLPSESITIVVVVVVKKL